MARRLLQLAAHHNRANQIHPPGGAEERSSPGGEEDDGGRDGSSMRVAVSFMELHKEQLLDLLQATAWQQTRGSNGGLVSQHEHGCQPREGSYFEL